jgi:cytochrome P450
MPTLLQGMGFWTRPLAFLERCRGRYGRRFTLRLPFTPPFVMLSDPDEVREVFTAPADVLHPGSGARVLEPIVGANSVILLDEGAHMEQRKLLLPAFHGEAMGRLQAGIEAAAAREIATWPREKPIEMHSRMQGLTLEIILRAVFGLDPGPRFDALRAALAEMLAFGERPISLLGPPRGSLGERLLARVGPYRRFLEVQADADRMLYELIAERRADPSAVDRDDILAVLLAARHEDGTEMSEEEIRDELLTMLVAGHETTASSLAWSLEQLSRHPQALRALRAEIDAGGEEYLTATIHETLRHRPVLPNSAPRYTAREIEVGGWRYPEGVCLVPNAYLIHHDPEIYPEPYAFRPERFLDRRPGTYTWIPFGGGRRRCLGASFALLEMQIVLRELLSGCELRPAGAGFELARRRNITIRPGAGARVELVA